MTTTDEPTTMELEAMLTPKQTAAVLRVSVATLADWRCDEKGPPFYRFGARAIRYKGSDLHAWIERQAAGAHHAK